MSQDPTNNSSDDSLSDEERWFDELYNSVEGPSSPAEVDARIALAASEAVQPPARRWGLGLASAAVVILSVGIFLGTDDQQLSPSLDMNAIESAAPPAEAEASARDDADAIVIDEVTAEPADTKPVLPSHIRERQASLKVDIAPHAGAALAPPPTSSSTPTPTADVAELDREDGNQGPEADPGYTYRRETVPQPELAEATTPSAQPVPEGAREPADDQTPALASMTNTSAHREEAQFEEIIVTGAMRKREPSSLGATNCKGTSLRLAEDSSSDTDEETIERCRSVYRISAEACDEPLHVGRRDVFVSKGVLLWADDTPIACVNGEWTRPGETSSEP